MVAGHGRSRRVAILRTLKARRGGQAVMAGVLFFEPWVGPRAVTIQQKRLEAESRQTGVAGGRVQQVQVGNDQDAPRPEHACGLVKEGAARPKVKHGFDAENAVKRVINIRQATCVGLDPFHLIAGSGLKLAAKRKLSRVDVDAGQVHAFETPVNALERPAESTADVEDRLIVVQIGHREQVFIEALLGPLKRAGPRELDGAGLMVPVPEMHRAAHVEAALEGMDEKIKVRRHGRWHGHPQQYTAVLSRFKAMKLQTVQRLCGPTTGETW